MAELGPPRQLLDRAVAAAAGVSSHLDALPPLLRKAALLYAYAALTALWAVAVVRRLRPGPSRLGATLPVLVGNLVAPVLLDPASEPLLITPVAGVFSLAAFKLLAFAIARGPLLPDWLTPLQFCGVYLLPIVPIQVFTVGSSATAQLHIVKQGRALLLSAWASTGVAMLVSWVLAVPGLPVMVRHWLYTLASATFLTGVFDVLGACAYLALGITAAPTFDRPWLCDSFQDFWARRWNLTTTYMMRVLVYEPVIEGRLLPPGAGGGVSRSKSKAAAAAAAAPIVLAASPGRTRAQKDAAAAVGSEEPGVTTASADEAAQTTAPAPAPAAPEEAQGTAITTFYGGGKVSEPGVTAAAAVAATSGPVDDDVEGTGLRRRRKADEMESTPEATAEGAGAVGAGAGAGGGAAAAATGRPRASKLRRYLGLQAVFLFSGLWHILIFWYNTHVFSWRWCAFFAIQAPILMAEQLLRQATKGSRMRLPHFLQVFASNFLLIAVARPLFFGPTDTTGFAQRNLGVGQAPMWALVDMGRAAAARFF